MASKIFEPLIAELTELTSVVTGTELLLQRLKKAVDEAPTLAEAQSVVTLAFNERTRLSTALAANTPAEEPA